MIDVSVVVAVKNEEIYIESALESILFQTGLNLEVVIVDDHSDDATNSIVSRMSGHHENLRLLRNPGKGKVAAFNYGVSQARGEYVCIFAGDDIMPPQSLEARLDMMRGRGPNSVGLCKIETMSENPKEHGKIIPRDPQRGALSGSSPVMARGALSRIFPVPDMLPNEDTWMEIAISYLQGLDVVHSGIIGCQWRIHENNSMNLRFPWAKFNARYTARMKAFALFREKHAMELPPHVLEELNGYVECELARTRGSILGILRSRIHITQKLRNLAYSSRLMYGMRRKLYGLLSGW